MAKDYIKSAVASEANNGRQPMGDSATGWRNATTEVANAVAVAKKGAAPDPLGVTSGAPHRRGGRIGASYRITAKLPGPGPEAQPTLANAKILPPTHSQSGNFYAQGL